MSAGYIPRALRASGKLPERLFQKGFHLAWWTVAKMQRRVGSHAAVRSHNPTPPGLSGIVNQEVRTLPSSVAPKIQPLLDSAKPLVLHVQWLVVPQLGKPLERSTTTPPPPSTTSPVHMLTGEFLGWLFSFSLFLTLIIHFLFIYLFIYLFFVLSPRPSFVCWDWQAYKQQTDPQAVCMSWHFFWPHSFSYVLLNGQRSLPVAFGLFLFPPFSLSLSSHFQGYPFSTC